MNETTLRLRAILDVQFTILVAACLLLALVGAGLAYGTHLDPETEPRERVVSSWSVDSEYEHAATVTEENSVFPVGTELSDRSTYFTRIAPELDGTIAVGYTAAEATDVTVGVDTVLVMESADSDTVYWREERKLASADEQVDSGETVTAPFTVNASAIDGRLSEIATDIGSTPGETAVYVSTDVHVSGQINGEETEYTGTHDLPLSVGGDTYSVSDPGRDRNSIERTEIEHVEREYGPLRSYGSVLLFLTSVGVIGGLVSARRRKALDLTEAERASLEYLDDRSEFGEWITRIRLPADAFHRPEAYAASLADLVDYAIDNDTGVVEDPETGTYHVVTGEYLYTYEPPTGVDASSSTHSAESADSARDDPLDTAATRPRTDESTETPIVESGNGAEPTAADEGIEAIDGADEA